MEPLAAAPPARGTRKGGSAWRAPTPSAAALPPSLLPSPDARERLARPPRTTAGPRAARVPEGAAPLGGKRRGRDYFLDGAASASPRRAAARGLSPARRLHRASSHRRRRRVRSPPLPPHHVPHPGCVTRRETRSRPAWVGARRPARARRPRDQSAALRPEEGTTPCAPLALLATRPGCRGLALLAPPRL
jgi:hypothetical protein